MEYAIGATLGVIIGVFATLVGFDRDRALYPVALIVIATYYDLFAVMGGSTNALVMELVTGTFFIVLAVVGFKLNLWIAAAGIAGHGIFDSIHHLLIDDPGVPGFWPGFCGSIDVVLGSYLAVLLYTRRVLV